MAEEWIWQPRGGMPQQPGYESREQAQDAVIGFLVERGEIGVTDPVLGARWSGEGDWRSLGSLPSGFAEGYELLDKNVATGQQVLRKEKL
jgi:hypothetical protein